MAAKTKKTSAAKKAVKDTVQAAPAVPMAKTPAPAAAPAVKPAVPPATPAPATKSVSVVERAKMIEIAAYLLAEKNGFRGDSKAYWLQAEKDVDAKLGKK